MSGGPGLAQIKAPSENAPDAILEVRRALARLSQRERVATDEGIGVGTDGRLEVFPHQASTPLVNKTATYPVTDDDFTVNCTSGTFTVTLLTAVGRIGRMWIVKNSGAGTITVACFGAELIDGSATVTLGTGGCVWVQSDGTNYIIVGEL